MAILYWIGYEWINSKIFGPDCYGESSEDELHEACNGNYQPNYNRLVNFANPLAHERAIHSVVIDLTTRTDPITEDILVRIASEPWWYNHFWRLCICILVPIWTITFFGFCYYRKISFVSYDTKRLGDIFGI